MTINIMNNIKSTREQTMIYKTLHGKLKIEQHEHHIKLEVNSGCSGKVTSSCSTSDTHCVTLGTNPVLSHD